MIYFTSDLHFGHEAVIGLNQRPFESVEEMAETIIENYNRIVTKQDTVYLLGDIAYRIEPKLANKYFRRLNGAKHLIVGNHDDYKKYDASTNAKTARTQDGAGR